MANFDFILPIDSKLYKGENEKAVFTDDTHTWFAEEEITAQKYGKIITKHVTTKDLRLINISSPLFHLDYIGKVNLYFRHRQIDDITKALSLMPLGLPTTSEARRTLNRIHLTNEQLNITDSKDILDKASYLYNAQRMSLTLNGNKMDNLFVNIVKQIYPEYDGYIQPLTAPTALFGGQYNHPEICIFKPGSFTKSISKGGKKQKGGGKKINEYPNVIHIPDFDLEKAIELDREKEKRKPKLRMLPPINILS